MLTTRGQLVEDAVTGRKLKIEEQLLNITMATGQGAVTMEADSFAQVDPEDLIWSLGAELQPGDRVRCCGRLGFIGWHNDDGALVHLGKAEPRLYCGRSLPRGVCGGVTGAGRPCDSCVRLMQEMETQAIGGSPLDLNLKLNHVEYDVGTPRRQLHLANEIEKASTICGVHVKAWNGATFHSGDVVLVENGFVTHKRSQKRVALHHAYKPLLLSPLPNARTSTVELVRGNGARRVRGQGGVVISQEPLELVRGEVVFEVVVKKYAGSGNEGLEIGVTTTPPERVDMNAVREYCAVVHPSWISSDVRVNGLELSRRSPIYECEDTHVCARISLHRAAPSG